MDPLLSSTKSWLDPAVSSTGVDITKLATNLDGEFGPEENVIWKCVAILRELQSLVAGKREVIAIALEDMKIVSLLMRVIACYGIYPCIEPGVGPPMETRTSWVLAKNPQVFSPGFLERLVGALVEILEPKDDLADIILIGPNVIDIMTGALSFKPLFEKLSSILSTYSLYQLYTGLLPLGPPWVQQMISHYLAVMPLIRKDAVRTLIEFLTGYRESEHVNTDRLAQVVQVLKSVPKNASAQSYAKAVGSQLFAILSTIGIPSEITTATVKIVVDLSEARPQMLGTLRDKILEPLLIPSSSLEPSLMALTNLAGRQSGFLEYLAARAVLPVWVLLVFLTQSKRPNGSTMRMLVGLINSKRDGSIANEISQSLGIDSINGIGFGASDNGGVESRSSTSQSDAMDFDQLTRRIDLFVTVLVKCEDEVVSGLFAKIIARYTAGDRRDPLSLWTDVKLLEVIAKDLKAKLFSNAAEVADLALGILAGAVDRASAPERLGGHSEDMADSDDEDEEEENDNDLVALGISLLSSIILEAFADATVVKKITAKRALVEALTKSSDKVVRDKSRQCLELIDTVLQGGEISLGDDDINFDDSAALLKTARESLANPLIPVRAHGLRLVIELIRRKNVISFDDAMEIMLGEVKDDDSFIYLNAIRGLEACSVFHGPGPVLRKLVDYKTSNLDVTLRIREAVTRITTLFGPALPPDDLRYLVDYFAQHSRPNATADDRLRMSALSILGLLIQGSPLGLTTSQESDVADLVLGVLTHERSETQAIVRRSALTLLLEVMNARAEGGFKDLSTSALQSLQIQLNLATEDSDELVRQDAREIATHFS